MPGQLIAVPRVLAPNPAGIGRLLRDVYCDKTVLIVASNPLHWLVRVEDDLTAATLRDPAAAEAFGEWFVKSPAEWMLRGRTGTGVRVVLSLQHDRVMPDMARYCRELGWDRFTILHIDSHTDLQSPTAADAGGRRWAAPVGEAVMELDDPDSVQRFVAAGFLGIGGFLLPLLAAHRRTDFVHWAPLACEERNWRANVVPKPFPRFSGPQERSYLTEDKDGPVRCSTSTSGPRALARLPDVHPVFVDIDFDAWCNVYDDSHPSEDCSFDAGRVLPAITEDLQFARKALDAFKIALISCALSPQFFPVPLWRASVELLTDCWEISWEEPLPWNVLPAAGRPRRGY